MFKGRIKGAHVPRLILAFGALLLFFTALYLDLIGRPIDFTSPAWGLAMLLFLLIGIAMLLISWIVRLDTRVEIFITLGMIALHVAFDVYILVTVFFLHQRLPVPLIQGIVEAYWLAGLLDVILMFWADNMAKSAPAYKSPEDVLREEVKNLEHRLSMSEQAKALLEQSMSNANHSSTSDQETIRMLKQEIEQARLRFEQFRDQVRLDREAEIAKANAERTRTYTVNCEICGEPFTHRDEASAARALRAHRGRAHKNTNHHEAEPIPDEVYFSSER